MSWLALHDRRVCCLWVYVNAVQCIPVCWSFSASRDEFKLYYSLTLLFFCLSAHTHTPPWLQRVKGRGWRHYQDPVCWLEFAGSAHLKQSSEQHAYLKFFEGAIGYQCSRLRIKRELMSAQCFTVHPVRFHSIPYSCFAFMQISLGNWEKASQSLTVSL